MGYDCHMADVGTPFLTASRNHLAKELLPRVEECLQLLSDGQIWWRPNEASNSIGNLVLHLCGNVRQWIISGVGGAANTRRRQEEFDERRPIPRDALLGKLRATVDEATAVLANFDPGRLLEPRRIQEHDVTVLDAIYHVVEHFSMHTGQIILLTKTQTGKDLHFYTTTPDGAAHPRWEKGRI